MGNTVLVDGFEVAHGVGERLFGVHLHHGLLLFDLDKFDVGVQNLALGVVLEKIIFSLLNFRNEVKLLILHLTVVLILFGLDLLDPLFELGLIYLVIEYLDDFLVFLDCRIKVLQFFVQNPDVHLRQQTEGIAYIQHFN